MIRNRLLIFAVLAISLCSSCAVLTKHQVSTIGSMAVCSDSLASAPSVIFEELSDIRVERGLFYAATLSSPEQRVDELEALYKQSTVDKKLAKKADASISVLESYIRSIKSLSNESRWKSAGTEIRGLGRNIDSMIIRYNDLEWSDEAREGDLKTISNGVSYIAESYLKLRQAEVLRNYLPLGDSLVGICTEQIIDVLKDENLISLIENEKKGLKEDYLTYLQLSEDSKDRNYYALLGEIDKVEQIRQKSIRSLQSLKRAHAKILKELDKPQEFEIVFDELLELSDQAAALKKLFTKKDE